MRGGDQERAAPISRSGLTPVRTAITLADMTDTPKRTVRVPDELWELARVVADMNDETLSDAIRDMLADYVRWGRIEYGV